MNKHRAPMIAAAGLSAVVAGLIAWRFGTSSGGKESYQKFLARMDELGAEGRRRTEEAQTLLHEKADEFAGAAKDLAGEARQRLQHLAGHPG
ncbi:hypothetical protein [Microlunatus sp. GCM10028923]|uniref:hypothetical protein n=1 Tax=Microlunatus sp. GCM10028923 TaxID=3273400 RepID=UPI0036204601